MCELAGDTALTLSKLYDTRLLRRRGTGSHTPCIVAALEERKRQSPIAGSKFFFSLLRVMGEPSIVKRM